MLHPTMHPPPLQTLFGNPWILGLMIIPQTIDLHNIDHGATVTLRKCRCSANATSNMLACRTTHDIPYNTVNGSQTSKHSNPKPNLTGGWRGLSSHSLWLIRLEVDFEIPFNALQVKIPFNSLQSPSLPSQRKNNWKIKGLSEVGKGNPACSSRARQRDGARRSQEAATRRC
jgi:hypothetical protein